MATTPYQTLGNIRSAIVNDSKQATAAALVTQVNRWINEGYEQVILRKKREWLDQKYTYALNSGVSAVATVTFNSQTVTFEAGTTFPTGVELQLYNSGFEEVYDVSSASSNVVKIATPYKGSTNTAANCIVVQPHILLDSNIRHIYQVYHQYSATPLMEVGPQQMREIQERMGPDQDYARYCTIFGQNSSGQRRLVIYPYPDASYTLYVDANNYVTPLSADSDEPIIPMQQRQILYHFGMYKIFSYYRNDAKAAESLTNFNTMLSKIDGEARAELDYPQLIVNYPKGRRRSFGPGFDKRLRD